jgi:hypothetical protein
MTDQLFLFLKKVVKELSAPFALVMVQYMGSMYLCKKQMALIETQFREREPSISVLEWGSHIYRQCDQN